MRNCTDSSYFQLRCRDCRAGVPQSLQGFGLADNPATGRDGDDYRDLSVNCHGERRNRLGLYAF